MTKYGNDPERGRAEGSLTIEQFAKLPEEDLYRLELVRGRVVREPRPAPLHARVVARATYFLEDHVQRTGAGFVFADGGFVVEEDPPTVRGPDIAFVARDRVPEDGWSQTFWRTGPDLAVEVLSPSNRPAEMRRKVAEYLAAGSRLVWIVDPRRRRVTVHEAPGRSFVLEGGAVLDGGAVLPGFGVALTKLFSLS